MTPFHWGADMLVLMHRQANISVCPELITVGETAKKSAL